MQNNNVSELFGLNVFNESVMRERLPKESFKSLKKTINEGLPLEENLAHVVSNAMKDWAIEKGATHYTHWFQPMTGITAEKHDAFISPAEGGRIIAEFSGKELIKGEPDASSFPSGGLRSTFEARGYTAWDPTSYAFVKGNTLCIPTAFCSYSGEALDQKTPLLRSMEAVNKQALRILKILGNPATRVSTTVGPEQEYFLIDKNLFEQRKDLIFTGRTLFGSKPPKGQELEDHYFGNLKERISNFMEELNEELWKLGIYAKTEHNEVAPAQHELAPIFTTTNIATDHNQLTMEMMQKIARRHDLVCLLNEKPFAGVNGSGKHNNWSISTNAGENLLEPGTKPETNTQFLLFLCAIIKAVDLHADLLRISVASAGNDHRLGANEAPPAIVSMFVGDQLAAILDCIEKGEKSANVGISFLKTGVVSLPVLHKDTTDRNRTSPFAFTGNKFEFRMAGSAQSIADVNVAINTAVSDALCDFADQLEGSKNLYADIDILLQETIKKHKKIIFNGNNYSDEWVIEAGKRGLPNLKSTIEALPQMICEKNEKLFEKYKIFSKTELHSRYEIALEKYTKTINIEALTMLEMAKREILPASIEFTTTILNSLSAKKTSGLSIDTTKEEQLALTLSSLTEELMTQIDELDAALINAKDIDDAYASAKYYRECVFPAMNTMRISADKLETIVSSDYWPFPTYSELLFLV